MAARRPFRVDKTGGREAGDAGHKELHALFVLARVEEVEASPSNQQALSPRAATALCSFDARGSHNTFWEAFSPSRTRA